MSRKRIAIVIYPGVTLLDAAGPAQVFTSANAALADYDRPAGYEIVLASPNGGDIQTDTGIVMKTVSLKEASSDWLDTVIVSGGVGVFDILAERELLDWVLLQHDNARRLATTCMGAFVTAKAGLLNGKPVSTHWRYTERLQQQHPEACVEKDPLFIRSGKMWSAAGVTSGIDLALAMVEEDHGHAVAMHIAQSLVVFIKRPGGQAQFSNVLKAQTDDGDGAFSMLNAWIAANLPYDLSVETLAKKAVMSPRTFARLYKARTGLTPARAVEAMRVDAAKHLLEQGAMPLSCVALATGLVDEQRLRRAFMRTLGINPADYRQRFGKSTEPGGPETSTPIASVI